ncbi:hypothetical protein LTR17_010805 [Elasticomyces elasticus]|nr:hypothetical protein LTR17_010805 [Elasticomyces elasticus]
MHFTTLWSATSLLAALANALPSTPNIPTPLTGNLVVTINGITFQANNLLLNKVTGGDSVLIARDGDNENIEPAGFIERDVIADTLGKFQGKLDPLQRFADLGLDVAITELDLKFT